MNIDVEIGTEEDGGLIQLTLDRPSDIALFTVRASKDTDVSKKQLEELGKACLAIAELMEE